MARSEAQTRADVKWHKKAYDAEVIGESLNGFLKRAVAEAIERDKRRMGEVNRGSTG